MYVLPLPSPDLSARSRTASPSTWIPVLAPIAAAGGMATLRFVAFDSDIAVEGVAVVGDSALFIYGIEFEVEP